MRFPPRRPPGRRPGPGSAGRRKAPPSWGRGGSPEACCRWSRGWCPDCRTGQSGRRSGCPRWRRTARCIPCRWPPARWPGRGPHRDWPAGPGQSGGSPHTGRSGWPSPGSAARGSPRPPGCPAAGGTPAAAWPSTAAPAPERPPESPQRAGCGRSASASSRLLTPSEIKGPGHENLIVVFTGPGDVVVHQGDILHRLERGGGDPGSCGWGGGRRRSPSAAARPDRR